MVDLGKILTSPQLPTIPAVAIGLLQLARDPDADVQGVIRLVKTDPAISAKLLKSANSSFFAIKSPVNSVERAIPLLGSKVVTSLALSFSLVDAAMKSGPLAGHYQAYWKQSIVQAAAAEVLAEDQLPGLTSECFLAGLLLDLGRLAMLKTVAMEYLPVLAQWEREGGPLHEIEGRVLGTDHIAVSVELSRTWKLPAVLVEAASLHHAPVDRLLAELQRTGSASNEIAVQGVAAVAAAAGDFYCSKSKGYFWDRLRQLTEKLNGYTEPALERFLERTRARIDRAGNLFEVHFDELGTPPI